MPPSEPDFLMEMFLLDSKNYHVWTYRHWLVRHFGLWDSEREIQDVERLITSDVRNNSAWNHRWVLKFGPRGNIDSGMPTSIDENGNRGRLEVVDEEFIDSELDYAKSKILFAPENRSPWSYARAVLRVSGRPMGDLRTFASRFVTEEIGDDSTKEIRVRSSLAVEWLADVFAEEADADAEQERKADAVKMLTLLKEKYDPIRKNYWDYRIRMLGCEPMATESTA
jgi:protein farnesyltransferase/geranylgeranyltransferase type-1 subunit alpha